MYVKLKKKKGEGCGHKRRKGKISSTRSKRKSIKLKRGSKYAVYNIRTNSGTSTKNSRITELTTKLLKGLRTIVTCMLLRCRLLHWRLLHRWLLIILLRGLLIKAGRRGRKLWLRSKLRTGTCLLWLQGNCRTGLVLRRRGQVWTSWFFSGEAIAARESWFDIV